MTLSGQLQQVSSMVVLLSNIMTWISRCITATSSSLPRRVLVAVLLVLNVMLNLNVSMEILSSILSQNNDDGSLSLDVVSSFSSQNDDSPILGRNDSLVISNSTASITLSTTKTTHNLQPMELLSLPLEERATILETTIVPYYVYNDDNITFENNNHIKNFISICKDSVKYCPKYIPSCYDALSEQSVLQSLKSHPWNINSDSNNNSNKSNNDDKSSSYTNTFSSSSSEMMIHVIPTPMIAMMYITQNSKIRSNYETKCIESKRKIVSNKTNKKKKPPSTSSIFDLPFTAVTSHSRFQQQQQQRQHESINGNGKYHVLLGVHYDLFASHRSERFPQLAKWYSTLQNITVAHHYDAINCQRTVTNAARKQQGIGSNDAEGSSTTSLPEPQPNHEYLKTFAIRKPVVRHSFVLGLGIADISVPLQIPTMDKFYPSGGVHTTDDYYYYIFYRTRTQPSKFNSTIYRLAPINMVDSTRNPIFNSTYSSIGYDLPHETWVDHMSRSKFCLAIRGDTPHTHALLRSIRAGCIPVVISDYYPMFASSFANVISMDEYCIFISEQSFISNPTQALLSLQDIPRNVMEAKIEGLKFVQRILFPDHPQTLFVPAFLQQTLHANERKWWDDNDTSEIL